MVREFLAKFAHSFLALRLFIKGLTYRCHCKLINIDFPFAKDLSFAFMGSIFML
jgi:hypothetical protein